MLKEKLAQHFRNSVAQHGVVPEMPHSSPKVTQHNSLSSLSEFLANSSHTLPAVTTITNSGHSRLTSSTSSIDSTTDSEASFESSFFSNNDLRLSNNTPLRQSSGGNPQLVLLRQTSLTEEKVAKNGEQKNVHVIVKNIPFVIQLGFNSKSLGDRVLDFNNVAVEAQLHYDCPERKKVDFVKHKPIEYKAHINERGDTISIEMRIKVLTSQLEDMFFRLRLTGVDSMTKEEIVGLLPVFTEPIKVVSKPDQVNRIKEKNAQPVVAEPVLRRKKRTASDSFQDTLDQIVKQQAQQQAMLQKLLERDQLLFGDASPCPPGSQSLCAANMDQVSPADQFEAAFDSLVAAYNNLDAEMRPKKIRKLVNKVSARDTETLGAMIDQFQYELSRDSPAESTNSASSFEFTNDKGEIEKLDYFYKEFLSLPDPSPPTY